MANVRCSSLASVEPVSGPNPSWIGQLKRFTLARLSKSLSRSTVEVASAEFGVLKVQGGGDDGRLEGEMRWARRLEPWTRARPKIITRMDIEPGKPSERVLQQR